MKIRIRRSTEKQHPLVYDSAIRYFAGLGLGRRGTDAGARRLFDRILTRPTTEVRLAVDADDADRIVGLAVLDVSLRCLHWAYVKSEHRDSGVARALLLAEKPLRIWHTGRGVEKLARVVRLEFDPMVLAEV